MAEVVTPERRAQLLDEAVVRAVLGGRRVVARSETQAVLEAVKGQNVVLHVILTLLTLGLWLIPWLFIAIANKGPLRQTVTVDEYGRAWIDVAGTWQPI